MAANRDVHKHIRYPANYKDPPALLKARIKAMLAQELGAPTNARLGARLRRPIGRTSGPGPAPIGHRALNWTFKNYYRCIGPVVSQLQTGHCGEYTALVVKLLLDRGVQEKRIRLLQGGLGFSNNHICVAVDAAADAAAYDARSYGAGAVRYVSTIVRHPASGFRLQPLALAGGHGVG